MCPGAVLRLTTRQQADVRAFFSEEKKKEHVSRLVANSAVRRPLMEHLGLKEIIIDSFEAR